MHCLSDSNINNPLFRDRYSLTIADFIVSRATASGTRRTTSSINTGVERLSRAPARQWGTMVKADCQVCNWRALQFPSAGQTLVRQRRRLEIGVRHGIPVSLHMAWSVSVSCFFFFCSSTRFIWCATLLLLICLMCVKANNQIYYSYWLINWNFTWGNRIQNHTTKSEIENILTKILHKVELSRLYPCYHPYKCLLLWGW